MKRRKSFRVRPRAKLDLVELADYIANDSLSASDRFLVAAKKAFSLLAAMPGAGAQREFKNPGAANIRSWPIRGFENYLIFYRATDAGIEVIRVLHGARDIDSLFEEPP